MRNPTDLGCTVFAASALFAAVAMTPVPASAQEATATGFDISDRRAAFSRQSAAARNNRLRQIELVNNRLTTTRNLRPRGGNAHASDLAIRFKGATPRKSAALETKHYIAQEKDRRTERAAVWAAGDVTLDNAREQNPRASLLFTNGVVFGADMRLAPGILAGHALGLGFDRTAFGAGGSLGSNYLSSTFYGSFFNSDNSFIDIALGAAAIDFSASYNADRATSGQRHGMQSFASARYSRNLHVRGLTLEPFGRATVSWSQFGRYSDRGANGLDYRARSAQQTTVDAGISGSRPLPGRYRHLRPHADIKLQWRRKHLSGGSMRAQEQLPGLEEFEVKAVDESAGRLLLGAGMDWTLSQRAGLAADYKMSSDFSDTDPKQAVRAKLRISF